MECIFDCLSVLFPVRKVVLYYLHPDNGDAGGGVSKILSSSFFGGGRVSGCTVQGQLCRQNTQQYGSDSLINNLLSVFCMVEIRNQVKC
jgi:hypothetical protein